MTPDPLSVTCPVESCSAAPGVTCTSSVRVRATGKPYGPIPPHYERKELVGALNLPKV